MRENDLQKAARLARHRCGEQCPRCNVRGEHDHNADSSSYVCFKCGYLWDREDYEDA